MNIKKDVLLLHLINSGFTDAENSSIVESGKLYLYKGIAYTVLDSEEVNDWIDECLANDADFLLRLISSEDRERIEPWFNYDAYIRNDSNRNRYLKKLIPLYCGATTYFIIAHINA